MTDRHFFLHEPGSEHEVCFLFGFLLPHLDGDWVLDEYSGAYPDGIFLINGDRVRVEFELYSANFIDHGHDPTKADMIVCWKHNWPQCPLRVLELSDVIRTRALQRIIKTAAPKYPVKQWTLDEFLERVARHHGETNVQIMRDLLRRLDSVGVRYMPGRGSREVTLKIYIQELSGKDPLIGIHCTPEGLWGWVDYQHIAESKAHVLRGLRNHFGEHRKKWHKIAGLTTADWTTSIDCAIRIALEPPSA